jgi:hypothetical protein
MQTSVQNASLELGRRADRDFDRDLVVTVVESANGTRDW